MRSLFQFFGLIALIVTLTPRATYAQKFSELFLLEYTYSTPAEGDFQDEIEIHEGKTGFSLPLLHADEDGVGVAVGGAFQANVWSPSNSRYDDVELYKIKVPVFIDFMLAESLGTIINITPGIHSDLEEIDEDDARVEGFIQFNYIHDSSLTFALGAAVGEEFGESKGFPIGGVRWQSSERLLFDFIFPYPKIQLALLKNFNFYLFGEPAGGEWNVGDSERTKLDIQQKGFRAGVGLEARIFPKSWIYAAGGIEGGRKLQIALDDNEVFDDEIELEDQTFFRVGMRYTR